MHATYDRRADVLSIKARDVQPKYVAIGRVTFATFTDNDGIWQIDLEAESWDTNPDKTLKKIKVVEI